MTTTQRLSVQEAADHFGVSASTIRRWIAADELRCEREESSQGLRVWVCLDPEVEEPEVVTASTDAASLALITALEERIRSLESILATELQAGAQLRAMLTHEQAAHQATRAELDGIKTQQQLVAVQPAMPVEQPRNDEEPATLNALATLRRQYEQLQDRNARLQAEVYSLIEKVAAQPQPVERPGLVARFFGAVGQESVTGFSV